MIYKRCSRCNSRIQTGTECECKSKRFKEYNKDNINKYKSFYKTGAWIKVRQQVISYYNGIDIYSYYNNGLVEYGQTVHHIEPIKNNWDKRLDITNLIYLTESNHRKLHNRMDNGEEQQVIHELHKLIEKFNKEMGK